MTRLVGLVFAVAGLVIGLAPAASALGITRWLIWIAAVVALFYAGAVWRVSARRQPLSMKGLLVALGLSAFGPATAGVLVLIAHLVGWAIGLLAEWIWGLFAAPPDLSREVAKWLDALTLLFFGLTLVVAAIKAQVEWLGRLPAERAEAAARVRREDHWWGVPLTGTILILAAGGLYAAGWARWELRWAPLALLQVALVFFSIPAWQAVEFAQQRESARSAARIVRSLLESLGFETREVSTPATDESSELLVRQVDFVARRGDEVLAVDVESADEAREPLTAVSSLSLAAWALASSEGLSQDSIRPLLVLVAEQLDPKLERVAKVEQVALAHFSLPELTAVQGGDESVRATLSTRLESAFVGSESV